jgi:hypothetical protein
MISAGLERRLAVVATVALTLAVWVLPASAAAAGEARPPKAASVIDRTVRAERRHRRVPQDLQYEMLYCNEFDDSRGMR